ncbi:hypothetical protein AYI68_g7209 [Smittium mucronatum]|uniref:Coilin tudor domain-containing protein n=1 Tax=Smittium mucronatum TaxID=133383 RepID=A0A1R0GPB3_9FUNG|nr:hypothetical protein AYI68_g7209 [Smittium mucronatum]
MRFRLEFAKSLNLPRCWFSVPERLPKMSLDDKNQTGLLKIKHLKNQIVSQFKLEANTRLRLLLGGFELLSNNELNGLIKEDEIIRVEKVKLKKRIRDQDSSSLPNVITIPTPENSISVKKRKKENPTQETNNTEILAGKTITQKRNERKRKNIKKHKVASQVISESSTIIPSKNKQNKFSESNSNNEIHCESKSTDDLSNEKSSENIKTSHNTLQIENSKVCEAMPSMEHLIVRPEVSKKKDPPIPVPRGKPIHPSIVKQKSNIVTKQTESVPFQDYIITRVDHVTDDRKQQLRKNNSNRVDLRFPIQNAYYKQLNGSDLEQNSKSVENHVSSKTGKVTSGSVAQKVWSKDVIPSSTDENVDLMFELIDSEYPSNRNQQESYEMKKNNLKSMYGVNQHKSDGTEDSNEAPDVISSKLSTPSKYKSSGISSVRDSDSRKSINRLTPKEILENPQFLKTDAKNYESMANLIGFPKTGSRIAFKTIELDVETSEAQVSEFQVGLVKSADPVNRQVSLEFFSINGPNQSNSAPQKLVMDFNIDIETMDLSQFRSENGRVGGNASESLGNITCKLFDFDSLLDVKLVQ